MLGWGAAYVPSARLVETWPPLTAAGARLGLAGLVLLGVLALLGRPLRPGAGAGTVAVLALTQTVLFYGATFWGIAEAGAGLAALLANTDPLFVAALAALVLGERLRGRQWLGLVLGLAGAGVVVARGPAWPPEVSVDALVVVGGALAWALGTIAAARGLKGRADPFALAGWQMTVGGAVLVAAGLVVEREAVGLGARELLLVAGLALLGSAAPLALFYAALERSPAGEVSAWFFLVPVVGVVSAWPLLGERPGPRLLIGLVAISAGLWLVMGARRRMGGGRLRGASVSALTPPRP